MKNVVMYLDRLTQVLLVLATDLLRKQTLKGFIHSLRYLAPDSAGFAQFLSRRTEFETKVTVM